MGEIDTDYLVVGAGASGMAFVDTLLATSDARVVLVDRRHRPGGHWLDAYPFVRLHQPSANYGVASRRLGADRIDEAGPNAGFYEQASADEIRDYYGRVLDEFVGSGRVRFLGMHDYRGHDTDGHRVVSLLTGADTTVRARKLVDATYTASDIPSRHTPTFHVDPQVRLIPPNDLVDLDEPPGGFTVIGAGKTAMDTCTWLLDSGVDPDHIQWIRPRDSWLYDRASVQPLELVGQRMQMQARWVRAAATATDGAEFAHRLEADGVFLRIDPRMEPEIFRGATISTGEIDALQSIQRVVRKGKVRHLEPHRVVLDGGEVPAAPGAVHIDCTAAGLRPTEPRPVFTPDRITLQVVTSGIIPWSAATIGAVETLCDDHTDKNRLCPPGPITGNIADVLRFTHATMTGALARSAEPDLAAWNDNCRLNPGQAARQHAHEPQVADAHAVLTSSLGPAMHNLARHVGRTQAPARTAGPAGVHA